ncbi:MFS transporter small subunit [Pseudarthrobacter sp. DSP2-3-2b1]
MSTTHTPGAQAAPAKVSTGRLGVAWALVGVPLAYGVYETLTRVAALFG